VHIVAAGMHDGLFHAVNIDLRGRGGIGEPAVFLQRQAVHVGAHQDGRAVAILHHRDNAGAANAFCHIKAEGADFPGQNLRRTGFAKGEFRVGVEIGEQRAEMGVIIRGNVCAERFICKRWRCTKHKDGGSQGQ